MLSDYRSNGNDGLGGRARTDSFAFFVPTELLEYHGSLKKLMDMVYSYRETTS